MIESEGIQCIDLGVDVDPSDIARVIRTHEVHLVCLSALLTTTIMAMKDVIDTLEKEMVARIAEGERFGLDLMILPHDFPNYYKNGILN